MESVNFKIEKGKILRNVVGWLSVVFIFQTASIIVNDSLLLPSVVPILAQTITFFFTLEFLGHLSSTLTETLLATFIAIVVGVPPGLLLGRWGKLRSVFESPIDWFRSIPATALFPVFLLFFGVGANTRIALSIYAATFAVLIPTMYGAAEVDKDRIRHMERAGLSRFQLIRHVLVWESMSPILAGIRLAVSVSLVLIVVGEMFIGSNQGLGFLVQFYQARYATVSMYATVLIIGLLGYGLNRLVRLAENKLL